MRKLLLVLMPIVALIAVGAYFWLRQSQQQLPPPVPIVSPPPVASSPAIVPPKPPIGYPVAIPPGMTELPPVGQADDFVIDRITKLLGAKNVKTYLVLEGFVRRVVATVDNLARPLAPPKMWPIRPAPGRFTVETGAGGAFIGAKNEARYAPFVRLVESVDSGRAVVVYQQLYPLFQRAYESLGYPGKYFNDRLVEVIDLLLETPEPPAVLKVELPQFNGPLKPMHPWVLYRFSDPTLDDLASGQKILLRMGPENEKRLKLKLAEVRKLIVADKASR